MFQSGHSEAAYPNFNDTLADYRRTPSKPVLDGEPNYEDHPIDWKPENGWFDAFDSRRAGYWSMLSGALGHTYGHHSVWQMWQPGRAPVSKARTPWQQAIDYPGARQAGYMRAAFESEQWQSLVPAQERLADAPTEVERSIRVAANADGSLVVAYAPFGDTFALRLGPADPSGLAARWSDPRDGSAIPVSITVENGVDRFDPPSDPKRGNDWLLILSPR